MKLAIIGSRTFNDYNLLWRAVHSHFPGHKIELIISGGASGADALAEKLAKQTKIPLKVFPADWKTHGKAAGPIRNKQIIGACDEAICFHDGKSRGSLNVIDWAKRNFEI